MILKRADRKDDQIQQLEAMVQIAPADIRSKVTQELRSLRAGIRGEEQSAYLIDFHFKDAPRTVVIHDLRLEIDGRVAQIDHLLIHRTLNCYVLETKTFHSGIKITEEGDFLAWNDFKKKYEAVPSPLAQNERHVEVLKKAFETVELPTRAGIRLSPVCHSYILVSPQARIVRPKNFDTTSIIRPDDILRTIEKQFDSNGVIDVLSNVARMVSQETLLEIGQKIVNLHKPASFNYAVRFGVQSKTKEDVKAKEATSPRCPLCGAEMKERTARHGKTAGRKFWGCALFPKCRGTLELGGVADEDNSTASAVLAAKAAPPAQTAKCPDCGTEMMLRQFQSGPKSGQQFYGCVLCKKGWPVEHPRIAEG